MKAVAVARQAHTVDPDVALQRAERAVESGRTRAALKWWGVAYAWSTDDSRAREVLAARAAHLEKVASPELASSLMKRARAKDGSRKAFDVTWAWENAAIVLEHLDQGHHAAHMRMRVADVYREIGATFLAIESLQVALPSLVAAEDAKCGQVRRLLALMLAEVGEHQSAVEQFDALLADSRGEGSSSNRAAVLMESSESLCGVGLVDEARRRLERAVELFTVSGDELGVAKCRLRLGRLVSDAGHYDEAIDLVESARGEIASSEVSLLPLVEETLASTYLADGRVEDAAKSAGRGAMAYQVLGDDAGRVRAKTFESECWNVVGDRTKALGAIDEAAASSGGCQEMVQAEVLVTKGRLLMGDGRMSVDARDQAREALRQARALYETHRCQDGVNECDGLLESLREVESDGLQDFAQLMRNAGFDETSVDSSAWDRRDDERRNDP